VILGGYGNFGARICRALAKLGEAEIVIAGRNRQRANRLADELSRKYPRSRLRGAELDCEHPHFVRQLGAIAPIIVVHTAGPFQGQDYSVAQACLACRSHYIDLADGRRFVTGFGKLDRDARRKSVLLVTGASTLPGISSALIDDLTSDLSSVTSIETSIAPAGRTQRGEATIAAVLSYCGKPFDTFENSEWTARYGWQDRRRVNYGPFTRSVAACDVPDLELLPRRYPGVQSVTFHAGPEPRWQHISLWLMAALTRAGLVRDWSRYSRLFTRADAWLTRFGTEIGAMQVRVLGVDTNGKSLVRRWNLIAKNNHGPEIPCVPAIVLAKKLLTGRIRERGARPCMGLITLDEVTAEFDGFAIDWTVSEERIPCYRPT